MLINANTKISAILKEHPNALEAIISISPKFNKLRNPLLRKLMASRTTIGMASKIGGCEITDFFNKLQPLGFTIDRETKFSAKEVLKVPDFMKNVSAKDIYELDVRPVIEGGKDPLNLILEKIKQVKKGQILKLINSFEPTPLIHLLEKRGFDSYTEVINGDLVNTYFHKREDIESPEPDMGTSAQNFEEILQRFKGKTNTVDVRKLEMPLPMITILDELDNLPANHALFVYHKRIPVFLLPELKEKKFDYRIKEISEEEVHLLIFRT